MLSTKPSKQDSNPGTYNVVGEDQPGSCTPMSIPLHTCTHRHTIKMNYKEIINNTENWLKLSYRFLIYNYSYSQLILCVCVCVFYQCTFGLLLLSHCMAVVSTVNGAVTDTSVPICTCRCFEKWNCWITYCLYLFLFI